MTDCPRPPQLDVVQQSGLVEVHEAAVVVDLLGVAVLGGVELVVGGGAGGEAAVPGLHHGPLLPDLHDVPEHEPVPGVAHPHLVVVHCLDSVIHYLTLDIGSLYL